MSLHLQWRRGGAGATTTHECGTQRGTQEEEQQDHDKQDGNHDPCFFLYVRPPSTSNVGEMRAARNELRRVLDEACRGATTTWAAADEGEGEGEGETDAEEGGGGGTVRRRVRLLFDLRECAIGLPQLHFTVRTLLKNEAYMRRTLERSAALVPPNRAVKALCDLFLRMYTPVRPFAIEIDYHKARAFVTTTKTTKKGGK